jgi:hypothetical protein
MSYWLDDLAAAFVAGLEQGKAERLTLDVTDLVQAELHSRALEALGMASTHAARTGPAWSALVHEAGEVG